MVFLALADYTTSEEDGQPERKGEIGGANLALRGGHVPMAGAHAAQAALAWCDLP
jgi:hypothetical protein